MLATHSGYAHIHIGKKVAMVGIMTWLLCPVSVFAEIRINEIAWMGTLLSANEEWVELVNTGDESISLDNWRLYALDGSPAVTLSGTIEAQGFFLLERTDDDTVPDITADQIYTGALGNEGESLVLVNHENTTIDSVNQSSGWTAGDNVTKYTMQYSNGNWITASGTPRATNSDQDTDNEEEEEENNNENNNGTTNNTQNNQGSTTQTKKKVYDEEEKITHEFALQLQQPAVVVAGVPARFSLGVFKDGVRQIRGIHSWSFGDGTFTQNQDRYSRQDLDFFHTYEYPGTYIAVFEYRTSGLKKDPDIRHRITVQVTEHQVIISDRIPGKYIELHNLTSDEIDIGSWQLLTQNQAFIIPPLTIIPPKTKVRFAQKNVPLPLDMHTRLVLPDGSFITEAHDESQKNTSISSQISLQNVMMNNSVSPDTVMPITEKININPRYVHEEEGNRNNNYVWYILFGIISIGGSIAGVALYWWIKQNRSLSHDQDSLVDEITLLEDEE